MLGLIKPLTLPTHVLYPQAIRFKGRVYAALRADSSSSSSAPRPAVMWLQLTVTSSTTGTQLCPASTYGASAAKSFDYSKDYTVDWGSEWDKDWKSQPRNLQQVAAAAGGGGMGVAGLSGGGSGGVGVSPSGNIIMPNKGSNQMRVSNLLGDGCSCYDCYWGGAYYLFGGYQGGTVNQPGIGYSGIGYLAGFYSGGIGQNYWSYGGGDGKCYIKCQRCWYYGFPGYGFGYDPKSVTIGASFDGAKPADIGGAGAGSVSAADFNRLLRPCNRTAEVVVGVVKQGVASGSGSTMGLAYPVIHATPNGTLVLVYGFSGAGKVTITAADVTTMLPGKEREGGGGRAGGRGREGWKGGVCVEGVQVTGSDRDLEEVDGRVLLGTGLGWDS